MDILSQTDTRMYANPIKVAIIKENNIQRYPLWLFLFFWGVWTLVNIPYCDFHYLFLSSSPPFLFWFMLGLSRSGIQFPSPEAKFTTAYGWLHLDPIYWFPWAFRTQERYPFGAFFFARWNFDLLKYHRNKIFLHCKNISLFQTTC